MQNSPKKTYRIFTGLDEEQIRQLLLLSARESYRKGEVILAEGRENHHLYLIEEGSATVQKKVGDSGGTMTIAMLNAGECFGDMSVIGYRPAGTSVEAETDIVVRRLSEDDLSPFPEAAERIRRNITTMIVDRLGATNEKLTNALVTSIHTERELALSVRMREEFSHLFILITIIFSLYNFAFTFLDNPKYISEKNASDVNTIFTLCLASGMMFLSFNLMKRSNLPISEFGITLNKFGTAFKESMVATLIVLAGLVLLKVWAIAYVPAFKNSPLIHGEAVNWTFFAYLFVAPAQEFIGRGVCQGSIQRILTGNHRTFWAVVLAALLFGVTHTFYSLELAVLSTVSSLIWGWLYTRHKSIAGIAISHFIIGNALMVLDFWKYLSY